MPADRQPSHTRSVALNVGRLMTDYVVARFGENLRGRRFALWGLAFKPDTDDMREAPSRVVISELLKRGAKVTAYDPVAMDEARRVLSALDGIDYAQTAHDALEGADALLVVTEWKEFKSPDFELIRRTLHQPVIIDGRNLYEPALLAALGIQHDSIGRRR